MARLSSQAVEPVRPMRLRQAPLLFAAIWFASGVGLTRLSWPPTGLLLTAFGLLGLLGVASMRRGLRVAWLPVGAVWFVAGMLAAEWRPPTENTAELAGLADGLSRQVRGTVVRVRVLPPEVHAGNRAEQDSAAPWELAETEPGAGPDAASGVLSIDLAIDAVEQVTPDRSEMAPVAGGVRVTVYPERDGPERGGPERGGYGSLPVVHCGQRLAGTLRMHPPERYRDPGAWQYADYLAAQGIAVQASAEASTLTALPGSRPAGTRATVLHCRLGEAQGWASARLLGLADSAANHRLPRPLRLTTTDAGTVAAMLFGDRTRLDRGLRAGFERTGSFHLFVVSGLHVALVAGAVFWLVRRLRGPRWLATAVTIVAATGYAALTGFGQPVQRALAMVVIYLLARLLDREREPLNALGVAVLFMLLWAPASLFDASFQMTLLAVVAIAGIAVPLGRRGPLSRLRSARGVYRLRGRGQLSPRAAQLRFTLELWGELLAERFAWPGNRFWRMLPARLVECIGGALELLLISLVAELVMALPMAVYFHRATPLALPANLLVLPVVALLVGSAVAMFLLALVSPSLAIVPGAVTAGLLHGVEWLVGRLSHLPTADVRVPGPGWPVLVVAGLGLAFCCWAVRRGGQWAAAACLALPAIASLALVPEPFVRTPGVLEVTAIDVGQGDSILVVGPDGRTMLIDAGGPIGRSGQAEATSSFDVGEDVVSPYLWSRQLGRLDLVVLTHAHTDHMGGMGAVLETFRPRELWIGSEPDSPILRALLVEARTLGVRVRTVRAGEAQAWGPVAISVLAPEPGYRNTGKPKNDDSVVLRLQFGRASALLEGDAERPSEQAMVAAGRVAPVTLLKVGHHGSHTSSTAEFLAAAQPEDAVISAGRGNPFGHPREDVIGRFAGDGVRLFRTDTLGFASFLLRPDGGLREVVSGGELPGHGRGSQHWEPVVVPVRPVAPVAARPAVPAGTKTFPAPFTVTQGAGTP